MHFHSFLGKFGVANGYILQGTQRTIFKTDIDAEVVISLNPTLSSRNVGKGVGTDGLIHQVLDIVDKVTTLADNPASTNSQILNPDMLGDMSGIDAIDNKLGCANVLDGVLNLLCQRRKAAIKTNHQLLVILRIELPNSIELLRGHTQGLFYQDMLTCLQALNDHLSMQIMTCADNYKTNIGIAENAFIV